jgi:hypothetical protein
MITGAVLVLGLLEFWFFLAGGVSRWDLYSAGTDLGIETIHYASCTKLLQHSLKRI